MSRLNPESLAWLDQVKTLQGELNNASRDEIQKALNLSTSHVTNLLRLKACFDAQALEKVRLAASQQMAFILSLKSALALAGLKKAKLPHLPGTVHTALDFILAHRLSTGQIKALVEWIKAGKPIEKFDPKAKLLKTVSLRDSEETPEDEEENNSLTWKEMHDHAKKTNSLGSFYLIALMVFGLLVGLGWLIWKALLWLIHLF
jgi:hypothetical protein